MSRLPGQEDTSSFNLINKFPPVPASTDSFAPPTSPTHNHFSGPPLLSIWRTARRGTGMRAQHTSSEPTPAVKLELEALHPLPDMEQQRRLDMEHRAHQDMGHPRRLATALLNLPMEPQRPRTGSLQPRTPMRSASSLAR